MREILYRGKRKDNGEWVYGYYCRCGWTGMEKDVIIPSHASALYGIDVIPETVGQYTELTDKNGTKIFEGDIVKCTSRFDAKDMVVIFETAEFHLVDCQRYKNYTECCGYRYFGTLETEVIGNIYDTPEMPKRGNDDCIYADFNKKAEV